jgi:YesN/AraC family two-component response regulator
MVETFESLAENLSITIEGFRGFELKTPIQVVDYQEQLNTLILVRDGQLFDVDNDETLNKGDILFLPSQKKLNLIFGKIENEIKKVSKEELKLRKQKPMSESDRTEEEIDNKSIDEESDAEFSFLLIHFEAKVYESVNFFTSANISSFTIKNHRSLPQIILRLQHEFTVETIGKSRVIKLLSELIATDMIRYILSNNLFVEELTNNTNFAKDTRLITILNHIKNNLDADLSNRELAKVADVSEDYVGQYFKVLTGINPQDYIEYQRMERAVELLKNSELNINGISHAVGYKDAAYFCRRFKMMYGISAGKMRRRELDQV